MKCQVGLEAEFLPLKDGKPVDLRTFCSPRTSAKPGCQQSGGHCPYFAANLHCKDGIPHDDFPALAEVRGEPGANARETHGNFMHLFDSVKRACQDRGLVPTFDEYPWKEVDYDHFASVSSWRGKK